MPMIALNRRRVLLFALAAPLFAGFAGCDPNPNGPTFPTVKPENDGEDDAGPGAPDPKGGRGRRKKKNATSGVIGDPAA